MPKGVEHKESVNTTGGFIVVSFPVMPKGVEHRRPRWELIGCQVSFPVMPKGVEHSQSSGQPSASWPQ